MLQQHYFIILFEPSNAVAIAAVAVAVPVVVASAVVVYEPATVETVVMVLVHSLD